MPHSSNPNKEPAGMRHMTKKPKSGGKDAGVARSTMGTGRRNADGIKGAMGKHQSTGTGGA